MAVACQHCLPDDPECVSVAVDEGTDAGWRKTHHRNRRLSTVSENRGTVAHAKIRCTGRKSGLYEKYLPYALALEVEQAWGDQFLALASTFHQNAGLAGAESFYLGMWNGKPVEVVYKPEPSKGRAF